MITFRPDTIEHDPNVLVSVTNLLPVRSTAWRSPFAQETNTYPSIASFTPYSAFLGVKSGGTTRLFITSDTVVKEANGIGTGWNTLNTFVSSLDGFSFCQVGDTTVLASASIPLQYSTTGAFTTLASGVQAKCIATLEGAIAAWNVTYNGVVQGDGLVISDIENIQNFTPQSDFSSLAYSVRLTDSPGAGTAIIAFRDMLCIFKRRGFWIAQFTGAPEIWNIRLVSQDVGCVGKDACIVAGDRLYFLDNNDVYEFDGAQVRSIAPNSRSYFMSNAGAAFNLGTGQQMAYDDVNNLLVLLISSRGGGGIRSWAYCPDTGEWGEQDLSGGSGFVACLVQGSKPAFADFLGGNPLTLENRMQFLATAGGDTLLMNGNTPTAGTTLVTSVFGDHDVASSINRVYFDATDVTTAALAIVGYRGPSTVSTQQTSSSDAALIDAIADVTAHGHFFKITVTGTGITGLKNIRPIYVPRGKH